MESRNEPRRRRPKKTDREGVSRTNQESDTKRVTGSESSQKVERTRPRSPNQGETKRPLTVEERKRRIAKRRQLEKEQVTSSTQHREPRVKQASANRRPTTKSSKEEVPKKLSPIQKTIAVLWNILFYVATLGLIFSAVLFTLNKEQDKSILGFRVFGVLTGSMIPQDKANPNGGFYPGDVIIVRDIPGEAAEIGDIVTYRPTIDSDAFLTHRVVEKLDHLGEQKGTFYITRGDANNTDDTIPVSAEQIVAKKIFTVPKIGSILSFVRDNFVVSLVFIVSLFGFIYVMRLYFFKQ